MVGKADQGKEDRKDLDLEALEDLVEGLEEALVEGHKEDRDRLESYRVEAVQCIAEQIVDACTVERAAEQSG